MIAARARRALKARGLTAIAFELTAALKWRVVGVGRVLTLDELRDADTALTEPFEEYTLVAQVLERDVAVIRAARILDVDGLQLQMQSFDDRPHYTEICYTAVRNNGD